MAVDKSVDTKTGIPVVIPEVKNGDGPQVTPDAKDRKEVPKGYHGPKVGGKPRSLEKDKYGEATVRDPTEGKDVLAEARKLAPKADDPTSAAADAMLDIAAAIKMADPMAKAQMLKNMMSMLNMVRSTMSANSPTHTKKTVTKALNGALAILSKRYGFQTIVNVFNSCLRDGGINQVDPDYQGIVKEALSLLINNAVKFGPDQIPIAVPKTQTKPEIFRGRVPLPIIYTAPDFYVRQYYTIAEDPWLLYIQWKEPKGDFYYTLKPKNEPVFETVDDHMYSLAEEKLARDLAPYIDKQELHPADLNKILFQNMEQAHNNSMDSAMGKNAAANIMSMLPMLLGILGGVINLTKGLHLPQSVLNAGAVGASLGAFAKNMAFIKKMKMDSAAAFDMPSAGMGMLAGGLTGGLASMALGGGLGGLSSLAGSLGSIGTLGNLAGGLGAVADLAGGVGSMAGVLTSDVLGDLTSNLNLPLAGELAGAISGVAAGAAAGAIIGGATGLSFQQVVKVSAAVSIVNNLQGDIYLKRNTGNLLVNIMD